MEAVGGVFILLSLASLVAVIKPFGPYKKRWQALIGFFVLGIIGGAFMPDPPPSPTSESQSVAGSALEPGVETLATEPVVSEPTTRWVYSRQRDEMRDANTDLACISSTNELQFSFPYQGGSSARICFRQSPQYGFDAWVSIDPGQFTCVLDCTIRVKFGDSEIQAFSAGGASDGSSDIVFVSNATRFLNGARGADRIIVEAEFFQAGNHQMVFEDTAGLEWPRPQ